MRGRATSFEKRSRFCQAPDQQKSQSERDDGCAALRKRFIIVVQTPAEEIIQAKVWLRRRSIEAKGQCGAGWAANGSGKGRTAYDREKCHLPAGSAACCTSLELPGIPALTRF